MALDIVFEHSDLFPNEEFHTHVMETFKFKLLQEFNIVTINRQVVTFLYNPDTLKFKLIHAIPKYRYNIETTIEKCRFLSEQME